MKDKCNHNRRIRANQQGVSIVSVLLGLVIGASVLAVTFNQYQDSQRKARIEAATAELTTMISEAQKIYGTANQFGAVTTAVAVQGGVVPPRLRIAGTNNAQNRYNGAITFAPATITSANDSLTLTYSNVTAIDCQDLVLTLDRLNRRIAVGATVVKPNDGVVDVATMATACDAAATANIAFTFGRS
jgi:Tfp pilus assembly protein PilE